VADDSPQNGTFVQKSLKPDDQDDESGQQPVPGLGITQNQDAAETDQIISAIRTRE
jgi:hypothetical protein